MHYPIIALIVMRGSHGLSGRRAWRTLSSRPEGPKAGPKGRNLEVGARRAPRFLVINKNRRKTLQKCWNINIDPVILSVNIPQGISAQISLTHIFINHQVSTPLWFSRLKKSIFCLIPFWVVYFLAFNIGLQVKTSAINSSSPIYKPPSLWFSRLNKNQPTVTGGSLLPQEKASYYLWISFLD